MLNLLPLVVLIAVIIGGVWLLGMWVDRKERQSDAFKDATNCKHLYK